MDLNSYRKRLGVENVADSHKNSTIHFINMTFEDTPLFEKIIISRREVGVRMNQPRKAMERTFYLDLYLLLKKVNMQNFIITSG
jgi:hypothetical protein